MVIAVTTDQLLPLAGYLIGVTADRRREEQVELLRHRGALVVQGPTVRTAPLAGEAGLLQAIDDLICRPPDVTVVVTSIGLRGLVAAAESVGREEALLSSLASSEIVARGPKAIGAAVAFGFHIAWSPPGERTHEVVTFLCERARRGARIAVQRDGDDRPRLAQDLADLGADAIDVPVYRWALPDDTAPAVGLLEAICTGAVDAVTFTSSPAGRNLFQLAEANGLAANLRGAFESGVVAACVGPATAATLHDLGIANVAVPRRFRLSAMVHELAVNLARQTVSLRLDETAVVMQGRVVMVGDHEVHLTNRERGVLRALVNAAGAVVAKHRLLREVWPADIADEHAVEVVVARLRRRLGAAGAAIETVPRRGYRLTALPPSTCSR